MSQNSLSKKSSARSRSWCGTWNNYTAIDYESLLNDDRFSYVIIGKEIGESGTPHLQFYVRFENAVRFNTLKKYYPKVHFEIAKGNAAQNIAYCSKDGAWEEKGERPVDPATARDKGGAAVSEKWALAKELALSGRINEIPDELFIRYYNVFKNIAKDYATPPEDLPSPEDHGGYGVWLYGKTGTGKSYQARQRYPGAYLKISNNKWWDSYHGQDHVILDDLDKKHDYMCYHLKIWADRYSFVAETKGSSVIIRPKTIVVTSNYHPSEIWDSASDLEPILRRFKIEHIVAPEAMSNETETQSLAPGFVLPEVPLPVTLSQGWNSF